MTSSALLFPQKKIFGKFLSFVLPNIVRNANLMEEKLQNSTLKWTAARCGFLTSVDETEYRAENDRLPANGTSISRLSLAIFLIEAIDKSETICQILGVSGPEK